MEKQLRCKDCKWCIRGISYWWCCRYHATAKSFSSGRFACKKFVYKDK